MTEPEDLKPGFTRDSTGYYASLPGEGGAARWSCEHGHDRWQSAEACARQEIARRIRQPQHTAVSGLSIHASRESLVAALEQEGTGRGYAESLADRILARLYPQVITPDTAPPVVVVAAGQEVVPGTAELIQKAVSLILGGVQLVAAPQSPGVWELYSEHWARRRGTGRTVASHSHGSAASAMAGFTEAVHAGSGYVTLLYATIEYLAETKEST